MLSAQRSTTMQYRYTYSIVQILDAKGSSDRRSAGFTISDHVKVELESETNLSNAPLARDRMCKPW